MAAKRPSLKMPATTHSTAATAAAIKYHLVEAEEVNHKTQTFTTRFTKAKSKRKSKFNWSQFPVEDQENVVLQGEAQLDNKVDNKVDNMSEVRTRGGYEHQHHSRAGLGFRSGGRFGGRRPHGDNNGAFYYGVYVPTPDITLTAQWAKSQIEFYFTSDNLVRDIFLRQHMDVDGYVPLAFVGSFQAVYSVHQDYKSLFEAMKHSETIELDEQNEKIRLRQGWEKWVWPNADGGYGVPRYIKQTDEVTIRS